MSESPITFLRFVHLRGPSIWTYRPVLEALVDIGDLEDSPSDTIPGFPERLAALLPGLAEHRCSYEERGGFLRRLAEGTWPAHILEHVTLELQNLAGMPGGFGRARSTAQRGVYKVAVRAWHEDITHTAMHSARDLVLAAMDPQAHGPFDVAEAVARLNRLADRLLLDPVTQCIADAATAKRRRIPAIELDGRNLVQLGYGARALRIRTQTRNGAILVEAVDAAGALTEVEAASDLAGPRGSGADGTCPAGGELVDRLFPRGNEGRIPLVGIAGSRGTTAVAQLLARLLAAEGGSVGLACAKGLFLDGVCLDQGDCAHWVPARRLLLEPSCAIAVIENGCDALLNEGLAYDRCQVGVLVNIDPELLPDDGYVDSPERLCALMRTQVDVVLPNGVAVLNAADPLVADMARLSDGEVIFFAADPGHPVLRAHCAAGGRGLTVRGGRLCLVEQEGDALDLGPSPAAEAVGQVTNNVLAAVAAAWALGLTPERLRSGIAALRPDSVGANT